MKLTSLFRPLITVLCLSMSSCGGGGGGGGDEFVGAADVSVQTTPSSIDTGDRTEVRVRVANVHPDGILLKVRYPKGLAYFPNTAVLDVNDQQVDIGPKNNVTKDNSVYLVFFFTQAQFGSDNQGEVVFQLTGNSAISDGAIEVDADVNNPQINDTTEFNVSSPDFGAVAETSIEVLQ